VAQSHQPSSQAHIVKLRPSELPGVPVVIAQQLEQRDCLIPVMNFEPRSDRNAIKGEFAVVGQQDWAALCSRNGHISIVVVWGGKHTCPSELHLTTEEAYLQSGSDQKMRFSRLITRVKSGNLRTYLQSNGETPKFAIKHDGIADVFVGKASEIYYCDANKWERFLGAD
jgi:hypothetical protein